MATAIQRKAQIDPSRICTALLGKLLVAALILVPLAAMLFGTKTSFGKHCNRKHRSRSGRSIAGQGSSGESLFAGEA